MSQRMFESLEERRLMSVASDLGLLDTEPAGSASRAVQMMSSHAGSSSTSRFGSGAITNGSGPGGVTTVDPSRLVGKFKEKSGSMFFTDKLIIKKVASSGSVKGTLSIAWIVSDAPVKGTIGSDGRFRLKFEKDRGFGTVVGGTFVGKMSSDGNKLNGTFDWGYSKDGSGGAKPFKQTFVRYGK